ncbi:hypothetical protein AB0G04_22040 [Actinoplanes sp. NPDC023801]|uniref:hypothetical protein n=1 Tax=Actinoplanes sp. NPDC023801 TaxID=3154595 RepID=UPI00340BFD8E
MTTPRRRADPASFTDPENWSGGYYELYLEFGARDDAVLGRAARALTRVAGIDGWYPDRHRDPAGQTPREPEAVALDEPGDLAGTVVVPGGHRVVCRLIPYRADGPLGADHLGLCLPLGALHRTDRRIGGFPFGPDGDERSLAWRTTLDEWLAGLGRAVFAEVPFTSAVIGFELDADVTPDNQAWNAYLLPTAGGLHHVPVVR